MQLNSVFCLTCHSCWNSFLTNIIFDTFFWITIVTPMIWTNEIIFFARSYFIIICRGFISRRSYDLLITILVIFIAYGSVPTINSFWPVAVIMRMIIKQLNSILRSTVHTMRDPIFAIVIFHTILRVFIISPIFRTLKVIFDFYIMS